jgi:hypothetical protein
MSKRLQVVLDETELREIRRAAKARQMTVSEWVRQSLREARRNQPRRDIQRKLRALEAAMRHEAPTADIDQMLAEIEAGYTGPLPE